MAHTAGDIVPPGSWIQTEEFNRHLVRLGVSGRMHYGNMWKEGILNTKA